MNQNETRTLWISLGAALFAVFLLYSYTQEKAAELNKRFGAKKTVVIASKDILEMQTLDESMLELVEKPVNFLEPGVLSEVESLVGLVAMVPIQKGEQILKNKVVDPGPLTGLSVQVAPGKRAVTIPIDEVRGVGKLLKPGDRVDIVVAMDVGKGLNQSKEVKTLMQDVVILSTGLRVVNEIPRLYEKEGQQGFFRNLKGDTKFSSITIEAFPHEVQNIIYILSTSPGSLFLTLRHPSDHKLLRLRSGNLKSIRDKISSLMRENLKKKENKIFSSHAYFFKDKKQEKEKKPLSLLSKNLKSRKNKKSLHL